MDFHLGNCSLWVEENADIVKENECIQQVGQLDNWCNQSLYKMQETFGTEDFVSAVLHLDKTTPHVHTVVVSIVMTDRRKKKMQEYLEIQPGFSNYRI